MNDSACKQAAVNYGYNIRLQQLMDKFAMQKEALNPRLAWQAASQAMRAGRSLGQVGNNASRISPKFLMPRTMTPSQLAYEGSGRTSMESVNRMRELAAGNASGRNADRMIRPPIIRQPARPAPSGQPAAPVEVLPSGFQPIRPQRLLPAPGAATEAPSMSLATTNRGFPSVKPTPVGPTPISPKSLTTTNRNFKQEQLGLVPYKGKPSSGFTDINIGPAKVNEGAASGAAGAAAAPPITSPGRLLGNGAAESPSWYNQLMGKTPQAFQDWVKANPQLAGLGAGAVGGGAAVGGVNSMYNAKRRERLRSLNALERLMLAGQMVFSPEGAINSMRL